MEVLKIAILGSDMGGLAAATELVLRRGKENVDITIFEKNGWVGGIILTKESGDVGPGFLQKKRHPELAQMMRTWANDVENWQDIYFLRDDEDPYPRDETYAKSSGVTRYFDQQNVQYNSANVEAARATFEDYVAALCKELKLTGLDPRKLTPQMTALDQMTTAQWFNGDPLPGVKLPFPRLPFGGLESLRTMWRHDNGLVLEEQGALPMLRMMDGDGHGYFSGGTQIVRGGGATITRKAQEWLEAQGVKFVLNCEAHLKSEEPTLFFADGSSDTFDWVVVATPPSVHDECIYDSRFQMGRAQFYNVALKPEYARTLDAWDTFAHHAETWQSFLHRNTLVIFVGADACDLSIAQLLDKADTAFPGIAKNVVKTDTHVWNNGAFSFPPPNGMAAVGDALSRHLRSKIAIVGEWVSDEVGYPGAAVRVAQLVVREILG